MKLKTSVYQKTPLTEEKRQAQREDKHLPYIYYLTEDLHLRYVTNSHKSFRKRQLIHGRENGADLRRHFTENQIKILVCMSEKALHIAACEETQMKPQ